MTIDILSDLHINAWTKHLFPDEREVCRIWEPLNPKGDVLIVAGDIGEIPMQNVNFLKQLKELYYKEIVCVLGNHDLHCLTNRTLYLYDENRELVQQSGWRDYRTKIVETKALFNDAGIHLLDGEIITIDGITIGGSMGWYDGQYTRAHNISLGQHPRDRYRHYHDLQDLWLDSMPDDDIKPLYRFNDLFKEEYEKLDSIIDRCDIMISHINPSIDQIHQNPEWKNHPTCGFYSFEGRELMKKFKGSHWIFGHSHYRGEYRINEFNLIANALGYPSEHKKVEIVSIFPLETF